MSANLTPDQIDEAKVEIERAGRFLLEGKGLLCVIHLECALGIVASAMRGRDTSPVLVDDATGKRVSVNPVLGGART